MFNIETFKTGIQIALYSSPEPRYIETATIIDSVINDSKVYTVKR